MRRKFSVEPKQVRDLLALMGDDGDNGKSHASKLQSSLWSAYNRTVPGVLGIGPKTAASLVTEFKSIEELLANIDKIQNKKRRQLYELAFLLIVVSVPDDRFDRIEENVEVIRKALSLVELRYDVPLPLDFNQLQRKPIDRHQVRSSPIKSYCETMDSLVPTSVSQFSAAALVQVDHQKD